VQNEKKDPPRNVKTHAKHRREVFWQITFPLILVVAGLLFVCGLTIFSAAGDGGSVAIWRDISLIWIILPFMVLLVIVLALFGGLAYGVTVLLEKTPPFFLKVQQFFSLVSYRARKVSNRALGPLVRGQSFMVGLRAMFKK